MTCVFYLQISAARSQSNTLVPSLYVSPFFQATTALFHAVDELSVWNKSSVNKHKQRTSYRPPSHPFRGHQTKGLLKHVLRVTKKIYQSSTKSIKCLFLGKLLCGCCDLWCCELFGTRIHENYNSWEGFGMSLSPRNSGGKMRALTKSVLHSRAPAQKANG